MAHNALSAANDRDCRKEEIMKQSQITALYTRFSVDDDVASESGSITNQKIMLADYATKNGFVNHAHFSDDGYSGKNFISA